MGWDAMQCDGIRCDGMRWDSMGCDEAVWTTCSPTTPYPQTAGITMYFLFLSFLLVESWPKWQTSSLQLGGESISQSLPPKGFTQSLLAYGDAPSRRVSNAC